MDYKCYAFFKLVSLFLCLPLILIFLKILFHTTLTIIQTHKRSSYFKHEKALLKQFCVRSTRDLPEDIRFSLEKEKDAKIYNSKLDKIRYWIDDHLCVNNDNFYPGFCIIAVLFFLIGAIVFGTSHTDFNNQKRLYESNYAYIEQYRNYKNLNGWVFDAKSICERAEKANAEYFDINGNPRKEKFCFILEENYSNLKPIDTNAMWTDFFEMYE